MAGTKAGGSPPDKGRPRKGHPLFSRPEATAPGTKKAVMERRGARTLRQGCPRFAKSAAKMGAMRRSIPSAFCRGRKMAPLRRGMDYGAPRAAKNRGDGAWLSGKIPEFKFGAARVEAVGPQREAAE